VFDIQGNFVVAVPRERIKVSAGISSVGRITKNDILINFVKKISKNLKFWGPINFQFKKDKKGILKLIEINPRCSGGMAITMESGLNPPELTLKLLKGEVISKKELQWKEVTVLRYLSEVRY
jgi:carbamoyl-phosphate synthase large subunit